jgi:hypothetical protein
VLGDNTVGKTSFLEALMATPQKRAKEIVQEWLANFSQKKFHRNPEIGFNQYYFREGYYHFDDPIEIAILTGGEQALQISIDSQHSDWITIRRGRIQNGTFASSDPAVNEYRFSIKEVAQGVKALSTVPLLSLKMPTGTELIAYYGQKIQLDKVKREKLFSYLSKLINNLVAIEPSSSFIPGELILLVNEEGNNTLVPLSFYGDGSLRYFQIHTSLIENAGVQLMIDEIDTGIHYSRMKDFWKTILLSANENDVQLFASTHNLECIKYFKEALEELPELQSKARSITLVEHLQTKQILTHTNHFDVLESELALGNEVR